jgi:hypothetical protein|nr:MAG TPA: hypothetical protein [Caudoviricetes sp.]
MVEITADAAHVRDGTSGLIPKDWLGVIPSHARRDEVRTFTAIGGYYEAIGAFGYLDDDPDNRDAVVGELAVRLGVKPWEMGYYRHRYTNGVETPDLIDLRTLARLGAVCNEAELLGWFLTKDGVGGGVG